MLMKKLWIICFMTLVGLHLAAQDIVYSTLKDLLAHKGDTVAALKIEKRTKNQISLSGGADYKISADDNKALCKYLKGVVMRYSRIHHFMLIARSCVINVYASAVGMLLLCGLTGMSFLVQYLWDLLQAVRQ